MVQLLYEFQPHWNLALSNEEYHEDKTAVSSTVLKTILKSPKAFQAALNRVPEETNAFRVGSAVHLAILEPEAFSKRFVMMPKFAGEGMMKAKADWRLSLAKDAVILKQDEFNDLQEMINSVLRHNDACKILKNGKAELTGYYMDPETGIKCRIRPDFFHEGHMAVLDIKTTQDCEMEQFSRAIWIYRYDFQIAMYCEGTRIISGKSVDYPLFLAIEKKPPFEVGLYMADSAMIAKGRQDYQLALLKLKECIKTNVWESYQNKISEISLPRWALREEVL